MTEKQSIYDRVTAMILKQIEANPGDAVMPWHRPAGSALHIPRNATTDNTYRGINILMDMSAGAGRSSSTTTRDCAHPRTSAAKRSRSRAAAASSKIVARP